MSVSYSDSQSYKTPESFIRGVIHGALEDHILRTHRLVHVYTQIIHQLPTTKTLTLAQSSSTDPASDLRDVFILLRWNVNEMLDIIRGGFNTLPPRFTPERYILHITYALRENTENLYRWLTSLALDTNMGQVVIVDGKTPRDIAVNLLHHVSEIMRLLSQAEYYAQNHKGK